MTSHKSPACRAGCLERGSSGSTEAHRSKRPAKASIPMFYPIDVSSRSLWVRGDEDAPSPAMGKVVATQSGCKSRPGGKELENSSPCNLGRRGEQGSGDAYPPGRQTRLGVLGNKAAKSSTMKGPRGLVGEFMRRRCRTVESLLVAGKGEPLVPAPRKRALRARRRWSGGSRSHTPRMARGLTSPSDASA